MSTKAKLEALKAKIKKVEDQIYTPQQNPTWNIKAGKDGTNLVILRFLEAPKEDTEGLPVVEYHRHFYRNSVTGGYYVENCPAKLKKKCPACAKFWALKNEGDESAQSYSRQIRYFANVLIIDNKNFPEENGEVKLFEFGPQVYKMLKGCWEPEEIEGEDTPEEFYPFGLDDGANFKFRVYTKLVRGKPTPQYDKSTFDKPSSLGYSDREKKEIESKLYRLEPLVADSIYKTYEELEKRFNVVEGIETSDTPKTPVTKPQPKVEDKPEDSDDFDNWDADFSFD